jgi:hypothetical protein
VVDYQNTSSTRTAIEVFSGLATPPFLLSTPLQTSLKFTPTTFTLTGLHPNNVYKVYCATGDILDPSVLIQALLLTTAGFTQPLVASKVGAVGFTITAQVNANKHWLRCCAYTVGTPKPTALSMYDCSGAIASSDLKTTRANANTDLIFTDLPTNTTFDVYCGIGVLGSVIDGAVSEMLNITTSGGALIGHASLRLPFPPTLTSSPLF